MRCPVFIVIECCLKALLCFTHSNNLNQLKLFSLVKMAIIFFSHDIFNGILLYEKFTLSQVLNGNNNNFNQTE